MSLAKPTLAAVIALQALAAPEVYILDAAQSRPSFEVDAIGFVRTRGVFNEMAGELTVDRDTRTGSIEVTIQTGSLATGSPRRDAFLKGKEFFNAQAFPSATFKADHFAFDDTQPVSAQGTLTMLGISKPITLTITDMRCQPNGMEQKMMCEGTVSTRISRANWGMDRYALLVSDMVSISVMVSAVRKS
ncbi:YceI family protein [Chitinimonas naiadis]